MGELHRPQGRKKKTTELRLDKGKEEAMATLILRGTPEQLSKKRDWKENKHQGENREERKKKGASAALTKRVYFGCHDEVLIFQRKKWKMEGNLSGVKGNIRNSCSKKETRGGPLTFERQQKKKRVTGKRTQLEEEVDRRKREKMGGRFLSDHGKGKRKYFVDETRDQ